MKNQEKVTGASNNLHLIDSKKLSIKDKLIASGVAQKIPSVKHCGVCE